MILTSYRNRKISQYYPISITSPNHAVAEAARNSFARHKCLPSAVTAQLITISYSYCARCFMAEPIVGQRLLLIRWD